MKEETKGILYLLGAAICWSLGGLLIKLIDLKPIPLAGARSLIAAGMIALFLYATTRKQEQESRSSTKSEGGKRKSLLWILLGSIAYAGTVILFVAATKSTTAANAILLQYTAPIWVALFSPWLLHEPNSRVDWLAIGGAMIGMVLFFLDDVTTVARTGDILALTSGLFFALCIIALRQGRDGRNMQMVLYGNLVTGLIALPFLLNDHLASADILPLLLLGTVQLGLGYILFARGIARVTAVEGAIVPLLEPLLNPLWVALAIGEIPSVYSLIGGALVLLTVTGRSIYYARERSRRGASAD